MAADRLLLDTHALIWWWLEDPLLPDRLRDIFASPSRDILVSAVSGYEIAQKVRMGRLPALAEAMPDFVGLLTADEFACLSVGHDHAVRAGLLPGDHRDPFDRLIAAQALTEGLTVVTRDPAFAGFGCKLLW